MVVEVDDNQTSKSARFDKILNMIRTSDENFIFLLDNTDKLL